MPDDQLDRLRDRIQALDAQLVTLAAERVALAREVGASKRARGLPIVDYGREARVLEHARAVARAHGLAEPIAEGLVMSLIRASISAQDEDTLRIRAAGAGQSAVVVGGAGRMGRWMIGFLASQGYAAHALDPAGPPDESRRARELLPAADLVVCSAPPATIAELYEAWTAHPPAGVVVDLSSIKSPLIAPIAALRAAGARVASMHPMFGPSIALLRDADVVICDTGDAEATAAVRHLFEPTTARLVHVGLDEHDRIMADVLSLAHATAIAFALALPVSDHPVRSTTYQRLEALSARLVRESPDVYYEIQARNPYSARALEALRAAIDRIVAAASAPTSAEFRALFGEAQRATRDEVGDE
jgi:chorismate mutase/prephenate dehydrogenase